MTGLAATRRPDVDHWPVVTAVNGRVVVLVHGFGEHLGRWRQVREALRADGHPSLALDLPGHGRSGGGADVGGMTAALVCIDDAVGAATVELNGQNHDESQRPILFGHSMGGSFAAAYAASMPGRLSGLVLSSPALSVATRPAWQAMATRALAAVAPRAGVARIKPDDLSRDRAAVDAYREDPLVWHGRVPARTALAMYEAGRLAFARASEITVPVLILHGEDDAIVPISASRRFWRGLGSDDKELVAFPGHRHEVFHEFGREDAISALLRWLRAHTEP